MIRFEANPEYFGGTEYMVHGYHEKISPHLVNIHKYNQMVAPGIWTNNYDFLLKPAIIWLHNTPNQLGPQLPGWLMHPIIYKNTVRYIVPSEIAKTSWANAGLEEEKIVVLPNAIDEDLPFKENSEFDIPTLIYTSSEQRGLELLLRATDYFDFDFRMEIFGRLRPGENSFFGSGNNGDSAWIKELKNYDKMTFYGFSQRKTVVKHLLNADVFLYPSTYIETFCLAAVESIAMGLPAVVSNVGALPEVCEDKAHYIEWENTFREYVNKDVTVWAKEFSQKFPKYYAQNIEQIVSTVKNVVENYPSKEERQAKRQAMFDKYSWEAVTQKWIEFDNSLEPLAE